MASFTNLRLGKSYSLTNPATYIIAGLAVAVACFSPPMLTLAFAAVIAYILFAVASIRQPLVFILVFLLTLEILPPFFMASLGEGSIPFYIPLLLLPIGLVTIVMRLPDFNLVLDSVGKGIVIFLAATALSLPFAWWLSPNEVGEESIFRWLLLAQIAFAYFLVRAGARTYKGNLERWVPRLLMTGAALSASYGIVDFIWPISFPHPAAAQFIWLGFTVLRRAQGVFYEASNFANFCGFFLIVAAAALLSHKERCLGVSRALLTAFVALLGLAVLLAFSRSAWASVLVSLMIFLVLSNQLTLRRNVVFLAAMAAPLIALWSYSPELWNYFLSARLGNFSEILAQPNAVSSGRFDTWAQILSILADNPRYLLFGIGYKTLAVSRLFHTEIIADNGYLNLLLETGIIGLSGFLLFMALLLRTFLRLARTRSGDIRFWSAALFSFWCGECVQMLAVDAYTYWRNMVIFAAVMALVLNDVERDGRQVHSIRGNETVGGST